MKIQLGNNDGLYPQGPDVYDVIPFEKGWRVCKQDQSEIITTTGTAESAVKLITGIIGGTGCLCHIRVLRRGGDVESELWSFSPAPRSDKPAVGYGK